jgi:hypothetical protein
MNPQDFAQSLRAQAAKMVRAHEQTLQAVAAGKKALPQSLHVPVAALLLGMAAEQKGEEALAEHRKHFLHVEARGENQHAVTTVLSLIHRRCVVEGLDARVHANEILVRIPEQPKIAPLPEADEPKEEWQWDKLAAHVVDQLAGQPKPADTSWLRDCVGLWSVTDKPDADTKSKHPTAARVTGFVEVTINGEANRLTHKLVLSPYKSFVVYGRKLDAEAALRGTWRDG